MNLWVVWSCCGLCPPPTGLKSNKWSEEACWFLSKCSCITLEWAKQEIFCSVVLSSATHLFTNDQTSALPLIKHLLLCALLSFRDVPLWPDLHRLCLPIHRQHIGERAEIQPDEQHPPNHIGPAEIVYLRWVTRLLVHGAAELWFCEKDQQQLSHCTHRCPKVVVFYVCMCLL